MRHERDRLQELWEKGISSGQGRFDNIAAIEAEARWRLMRALAGGPTR